MILTFLLNLFYAFAAFIVNILPTGSLPSGFNTALVYFWGVMNTFSYVLPLDTILQATLLVLIFDGVIILWHFINWVIRKIPGMQ